jgi:hypothetical protein
MQNAQPYKEKYVQNQYEHGALQAMTGGEAPNSYYAIEAYERTKGEVVATRDYQQALDKYYTKNRALADPEEFQIGLEELTKQYMEGQTEHFLHGFAPTASSLESQYLNRFNNDKMKEQIEKNYNVIGDMMVGEADTMMNSIISDAFEDSYGFKTIGELKENQPKMYRQFFSMPKVQARLDGMMRDLLSHAQENGEGMGIAKSEVTEKFTEFITAKAVEEGLPELLEIMYIPDKDGVTIAGSMLSKQVRNAEQQAEAVYNNRMAEIAKMEDAKAKRLAEEKAKADKLASEERVQKYNEAHHEYINELTDLALHTNDFSALVKRTAEIEAEIRDEGLLTGILSDSKTNNLRSSLTEVWELAYEKRAKQEEVNNKAKADAMLEAKNRVTVQMWNGVFNVPLAGTTKQQLEALDEIEKGIDGYVKQAVNNDTVRNLDWQEEKELRRHIAEQKKAIDKRMKTKADVVDNVGLVGNYDLSIIAMGEPIEPEELYQDYLDGELTQSTYIRLNKDNSNLIAERKAQEQALAEAQTQAERDKILAEQKFMDATAKNYLTKVERNVSIAVAEAEPRFTLTEDETVHEVSSHFTREVASFREREMRAPNVEEIKTIANSLLNTYGMSLDTLADQAFGEEEIYKVSQDILNKTEDVMKVTHLDKDESKALVDAIEDMKGESSFMGFGDTTNTQIVAEAMVGLGMDVETFKNYKQHYVRRPENVATMIADRNNFNTIGEGLKGLKEVETTLTEESYAFYEHYVLSSYAQALAGTLDKDPDLDNLGRVIRRMNKYLEQEDLDERQMGIINNHVIKLYRE